MWGLLIPRPSDRSTRNPCKDGTPPSIAAVSFSSGEARWRSAASAADSAARSGSPRARRSLPARCLRASPGPDRDDRGSAGWQTAPACKGAAACGRVRGLGRFRQSGRVYITATSSAISATTPRSCVISNTAMPTSRWSRAISSRICAWTVTSRAVVGSSAINSIGSHARAIAIMTRWRIPPESSCGYW